MLDRILYGETEWGKATHVWFAPSKEHDPAVSNWCPAADRSSASPAAAVAFMRLGSEIDVRHVAPSIHVPTLVLHMPEDPVVPYEQARWLAEQIDGARFVDLAARITCRGSTSPTRSSPRYGIS